MIAAQPAWDHREHKGNAARLCLACGVPGLLPVRGDKATDKHSPEGMPAGAMLSMGTRPALPEIHFTKSLERMQKDLAYDQSEEWATVYSLRAQIFEVAGWGYFANSTWPSINRTLLPPGR